MDESDYQKIRDSFVQANYFWVLVCIILGVFSHVSRTIRWQILLEPLGKKVGFWNTFAAIMISYVANLALPRLGEVVRCTILKKYEDIPVNKSLGTVVAERVADTATLFILFCIVLITQFSLLSNYATQKVFIPLSEKFGNLTGNFSFWLIVFAGLIITFLVGIYIHSKRKSKFGNKVKMILVGFWEGIQSFKKMKKPGLFLFHSVLIWALYIASVLIAFQALEELSSFGLMPALASLVFGTFGIIAAPGGIGAYPVLVMETLHLYGLSSASGFAFGWILWTAQTVSILVLGLISFLYLPLINRKIVK